MAGIVTLVQERRFRLVDDAGVSHLFLLAHDAPLEPEMLLHLATTRERVAVDFRKAPGLIAHIASALYRFDTPQRIAP